MAVKLTVLFGTTEKPAAFLKEHAPRQLYPCHCVGLACKAKLMASLPVSEVGVGMTLEL